MHFFQHIQELRRHLIRAFLWLIGFTALAFTFMSPLIAYLKKPYDVFAQSAPSLASGNLTSINVFEVMTMNFKICFLVGFAIGLPFIVREVWKFVSPALYPQEKRVAWVATVSSVFLFYAGIAFGFYLIIPYFFAASLGWASHYANVMITYESYFNTLITMVLIFAAVFEVPVVLSLFGLAGILPSQTLKKNRKIVFLSCFIIGAILAPPDVLSLCLVALPMYGMVEISIYTIQRIEKMRLKK